MEPQLTFIIYVVFPQLRIFISVVFHPLFSDRSLSSAAELIYFLLFGASEDLILLSVGLYPPSFMPFDEMLRISGKFLKNYRYLFDSSVFVCVCVCGV